jgi:catechol 2,3-dioxygenase-like lactoylglutathione lyase family enzyme
MADFVGLSHIGIDVDDLARSEDFYTKALGGKVLWRIDAGIPHIDVAIGDHGFTIFQGQRGEGALSARTVPRSTHFAMRARPEDVDEHLERLRAYGVEWDGPIAHRLEGDPPYSFSWYFEDPDGYRLEFDTRYQDLEHAKRELARFGGRLGGGPQRPPGPGRR